MDRGGYRIGCVFTIQVGVGEKGQDRGGSGRVGGGG